MMGGGAVLRWTHHLWRWQAMASTTAALGLPSEDLGLGEGDGGVAVKLGRVHGMAAARARR